MRKWTNPFYEGDEEYDHSAGAIYIGLKQGVKIFGALLLFLAVIIVIAIFA